MPSTIAALPAAKQAGAWGRAAVAGLGLALAVAGAPGPAAALEAGAATPWVASGHAAARLIAAGPESGGLQRAGLEIRLDPGAITYWRDPGEAGLPPTVDTTGSVNVVAVTLYFPAPARLDEGGITAFGYHGDVLLPLSVILANPAAPATLAVALDYAVCTTLCLPAHARLVLPLPAGATPEAAARLEAAMAAVPRPADLGAPGPVSVESVVPEKGANPPRLRVTARADKAAQLFVEGPEGWAFTVGPAEPDGADRVRFPVTVVQRPAGAPPSALPLRLTLVGTDGAVDTRLAVDETAATP